MKFILFGLVISLLSCGISKEEYQRVIDENNQLKKEISRLNDELNQFKFGEERTIALIDQAISANNFETARQYIDIFNEYHPESIDNQNYIRLLRLVQREEERQRRIDIERRQGFESPLAENARIFDLDEALLLFDKKQVRNGEFLIIRSAIFLFQQGDSVFVKPPNAASTSIKTNILYRIPDGTRVAMLIRVNNRSMRDSELIELRRY